VKLNGRLVFPVLLLCFWLFMAYRAFSGGDSTLALVYLGVGGVLTAWRLARANA
jgi:hypothetical protein